MAGELTPKQAIFIAEFLVDGNGTRAAQAAGVPETSAAVTASRWLKNKKIAAVLAERRARRTAKLEEYAEIVDRQLLNASVLDVGRLYDDNGKPLPIHLLPEDVRRAINSVEDETRGDTRVQRVKIVDKLKAIELLGKRAGLFTDKMEHSGRLTLEDLVTGGKAEAA
jgi:phage terminase small subunit